MKFFLIHGAYGNPDENWFPWLKFELEKLGHNVIVPKFPTPDGQNLDAWNAVFREYKHEIDHETVFIGHSLGPAFILNILEKINFKIKACFFVAGFIGKLDNPTFDSINETFTQRNFNWEKIREQGGRFFLFNSADDPYVPFNKGEELAEKLGTVVNRFSNAGHFNEAAGYKQFPELLEAIKTL